MGQTGIGNGASQPGDAILVTVYVPPKRGRPPTHPQELVADQAEVSWEQRQWLRWRDLKPTIPTFDRRERRKPTHGHPLTVAWSYR